MAETREGSQTKVLTEENQTSAANENQTGINAENSQASIPEKQTIVTYTDDELVSFKDNMVSVNTKKSTSTSIRRLRSWFKEKHGWNKLISMQFQSKKHRSFSSSSLYIFGDSYSYLSKFTVKDEIDTIPNSL